MSYLLGKVFSKSKNRKDNEFEGVKETYGQRKRRLRNNFSNLYNSMMSGKRLALQTSNPEYMNDMEDAYNLNIYRNHFASPEEQRAIDEQGLIEGLYKHADKSNKMRSNLGMAAGLGYGLVTTYFKNKKEKKNNLKQNKKRLESEFGDDRYYSDLAYEGVIVRPEDDEVFHDEPEDKNVKKRLIGTAIGAAGLFGILDHLDKKASGVVSPSRGPLMSEQTKRRLLGGIGVASLLGAGKIGYEKYKAAKSKKEQEVVRNGMEDAFRRRIENEQGQQGPLPQSNNGIVDNSQVGDLDRSIESAIESIPAQGYKKINRSGNYRGIVRNQDIRRRKAMHIDDREEELEDIRTVHRRRVRDIDDLPVRRKQRPRRQRRPALIPEKPLDREENLAERQRRVRAERKESSYRAKLPPSTESILTRRLLKGEELLKGDNIVFNNKKKYLKVYV